MLSLKTLVVAFIAASPVAMASQMEYWDQSGCTGDAWVITDSDESGQCSQLPQAQSFMTLSVDAGCSITVYTDSNCSDDAITAGVGTCMDGASINSYSIDC